MTIERTIEIPDSHRIFVDLPSQIPAGKAKISINIIECPSDSEVEAFHNEAEVTEFATRLSKRMIHEAW
jgi:hypothetical protein